MSRPTEEQVNAALQTLRADYYWTVKDHAKGFVADVKASNDDCSDMQEAREQLESYIDGCSDVIYTNAARIVGFCSRYDWETDWSDMGYEAPPTVEQIAYLCLVGEVWEECESELEEYFEAKDLDDSDNQS